MSRFSDLLVAPLTVATLILGPSTSAAEPIPVQITDGSLNMTGIGGTLSIAGDHGFTFAGGVGIIGGVFGPAISCFACVGGSPLSLNAHWSGNDLHGTATFEGVTYTNVGNLLPGFASGSVDFTGSAVVPRIDAVTTSVVAPFLFQGLFTFPQFPLATAPLLTASLSGQGTATVVLGRIPDTPLWFYRSAVYEFEPVPEPATWILVGTALAGAAVRRRQRARRSA